MEINQPTLQVSVKLKWQDAAQETKEIVLNPEPLSVQNILSTISPGMILAGKVDRMVEDVGGSLQKYLKKENPPYLVIRPARTNITRDAFKEYAEDFIRGVGKITGARAEVHGEGDKKEVKSITFYFRNADTL